MPRPQEFNTEEALQQALEVFRRKGYAESSLADLLQATGLSKSSLYATFGNKHALFLRAFDRYREQRAQIVMRHLRQEPAGAGILAYFRCLLAEGEAADSAPCMLLRQTVELAGVDEAVRMRVHADFSVLTAALRSAIARGQADGSITSPVPADRLAQALTVAVLGMMLLGRTGLGPQAAATALADVQSMLEMPRDGATPGAR